MKVAIVGTRGIPAKYGGFETFAQELAPRLVKMGLEVFVYCPESDEQIPYFKGVKLVYLPASKDKSPLKYYIESYRRSVKDKMDAVICCGSNGYALLPQRWKKNRPIFYTNTDGIEHKRTKWNPIVRLGVRIIGEAWAVMFSDRLIADSKGIHDYLKKEYWYVPNKKIFTIEYGAYIPNLEKIDITLLRKFDVRPNDYYLVVSRLEPENNVSMILEGYIKSGLDKPLVVVGNLQKTGYVDELKSIGNHPNIKFVGGIYDPSELQALRTFCKAYFHGHSVGGTNPSLLEALGSGNIVIAHDNPFTREVTDNQMFYFSNPEECSRIIRFVDNLSQVEIDQYKEKAIVRIKEYYNWERIAKEYYNMLKSK